MVFDGALAGPFSAEESLYGQSKFDSSSECILTKKETMCNEDVRGEPVSWLW